MINSIKTHIKSTGFLKYFKNTLWVISEKVLRIIVAILISVWVARYLGPTDFGTLNYAQSFVGLFTAFSSLGLTTLLVRELVLNKNNNDVLLGTSLILQTFGSGLIMLCLVISIYIMQPDIITTKLFIIFGLITFLQSFNIIESYFQSNVQSKNIVKASLISLIFSSIIKITLILLKFPLIYFALAIFVENFILIIFYIFYYKKFTSSKIKWKFSIKTAKSLLHDSWPLILSSLVVSIYMKIDQVMIKEMLDSTAVGNYAAAVRLSESWYFIPTVISSSLFPAILNAKSKNESLYIQRLQNLYDLMFILAIIIAIPMSFLSKPLVTFLYGQDYSLASDVLMIHIWTGVFVFLGVSRSGWILSENLQRLSTVYLSIGMLSNIILNYIFIEKYGIKGAAYATLISQSVSVLFAPLIFKKTRLSFIMMVKSIFLVSIIKSIKNVNNSDAQK